MKLKFALFLTSLCLMNSLKAQDKKMELVLNLFPNYTLGVISHSGIDYIASVYKERETWKLSFSGNIGLEYALNEKHKVGVAIGYQNTGERTKEIDYTIYNIGPTGVSPQPNNPLLPLSGWFQYAHLQT